MIPDRELLRRYAHESSEDAFTELVKRHVNLVYGAALRQLCGNTALAQDVTQAVFTALAAKAAGHAPIHCLSAWLFTTTRFTVSHTVRTERRRQDREQKAQSMDALNAEPAGDDTLNVPPKLIDEVLGALNESDREAILLRFFEGRSFAEIGVAMDVTEDAARMRVNRALGRTKNIFSTKGIASSVAAIGAVFGDQVIVAPAKLAESAAASAFTGSAAILATSGAKIGLFTLMTTTKANIWLAGTVAILALGLSGYEYRSATILREKSARLTLERSKLQEALDRSEQQSAESAQKLVMAERRNSELQQKADEIRAPNLVRAVKAPAKASDAQVAEKMAQMKPLLEKGMPIKGAIIVFVDGRPTQRPVQFVIGVETRIEADDGIYTVTPALNEDGSVNYTVALLRKDPSGGPDQVETLPFVTQTPWGGFTLGTGNGRVIAFDSDRDGP
jgi:RNA polymerase sigma factor (sigma-70 family)